MPFYVNTAFSCELYMKAIIAHHDPAITKENFRTMGHRLDVLFERLPLETQNKIKLKIPDYEIKKRNDAISLQYKQVLEADASNEIKNIVKCRVKYFPSSFEEMLKEHANLFPNWRYFYEADNDAPIFCDEWFLYQFCMELHNAMVEIMNNSL